MKRQKTRPALLLGTLGALLLAGSLCSASGQKPGAKPAPAAQARILGHLELQSRRITIKSGGLFTVKTRDGKVVAEDLTLAELKAVDPVLQEKLERIVAGGGAQGTRWAGL